ncbi:MAG: two-component system response regulator [Planctomycetaceae bacterium]|nr:two-component system response regulator [Planctomycetaceae bacterium]
MLSDFKLRFHRSLQPFGSGSVSVRVLVADDSRTMRTIIVRSLASLGVTEVVEAADGCEAVAAFKAGTFDLVLTDWRMPNKSGLDLLREIRQVDARVPVVMVTTKGERCRVMEAIEAGVSDYLLKPFTADGLREKLESLAVLG